MRHFLLNIIASVFAALQGKGRAVLTLGLLLLLLPLAAEADRTQTRRLYANAYGDLALVGNMLVHCSTSDANCANARSGTGNLDNYNTFEDTADFALVDVDGDASTTNSSSSTLTMPAGSTVLWAGLYWGGRYSTSTGAPALSTTQAQLKFRTPAMAGYQTITPTVLDTNGSASTASGSTFQAFADVTSLVAAAGNGTYFGGGLGASALAVRSNAFAGWALVVVYENAGLPFRNFAVYDGFGFISNATVNLTPSGFLTPFSGPVVSRLGVLLWDGDRTGATAERLLLNGTSITNTVNPAGDVWNSTISNLGVNVSTRNPNYLNTLGVDIDLFNLPSGVIANGATSATIGIQSPGITEVFWFGVATFMTDIYVPVVIPNVVKTAQDMSPATPLLRGDTLRWNVVLSNTGLDSATNLVAVDNIPPYLSYVPGSLVVDTGSNAGSKSDTAGNDQAEYLTGPDRVVFRLGSGANGSQGGTLAYNQATSFHFDTIVNNDAPAGVVLSNQVQIQYNSQTLPATTFAASSAAATATVLGPPAIAKRFTPNVIDVGQLSVLSITVSNPANNPQALTGVSFSDSYPSGLVNAASPNPQVSCTPGSTAGSLTGGTAGGNSIGLGSGTSLASNGSCTVTVNVTSATVNNYPNTTSVVSSSNGGNGSTASATLSVGKPRISKAFAPATVKVGEVSTLTFNLQNPAGNALSAVTFSDALVGMQVAATPAVVNGCGGAVTAVAGSNSIALNGGVLGASGSCSLSVNVVANSAGIFPNTSTGVSSTQSGAAGNPSNTATLTVIAPPQLSKSFAPVSVRSNSPSTMTLVVSNPNTSTTLTGVAFSDGSAPAYPSGLANSTPANAMLSCTPGSSGTLTGGGNGGSNVGLTGGTLAPGGSCTITLGVQSSSLGNKLNITSVASSGNGGSSSAGAQATLVVDERLGIAKAFAPAIINMASQAATNSSTLTITISRSGTGTINGISFEDVFPAGLSLSSASVGGTCAGGTRQGRTGNGAWGAVAVGNTAFRLSGGSLSAATCTLTLSVASSQPGIFLNTISTAYSNDGGTAGPASATLTVVAPPEVSKSFAPDSISTCSSTANNGCAAGAYSDMTLTLTNTSPLAMTVNLVDSFDQAPNSLPLVITSTASTASCTNPTATPAASTFQSSSAANTWSNGMTVGRTRVRVNALSMQAGQTCRFVARVRSASAGNWLNTTAAVSYSNAGGAGGPAGTGTAANASATLSVGQIDVSKALCTADVNAAIAANATCLMTLTFSNSSGAARNITLIDNFPGQTSSGGDFTLANVSLGGSCSTRAFNGGYTGSSNAGNWTPVAAGNTGIRLTATVPTAGCTVTVNVRSTSTLTNTINAGQMTDGGFSNGAPTSATIYIAQPLTVLKSFNVASIPVGGTANMTIRLSNLNALAASNVRFTDVFPAGLVLAGPASVSTCGALGTAVQGSTNGSTWATPAAGQSYLRLTASTSLAGGNSCEITVPVTSSTAGNYQNGTGPVETDNIGNSAQSTASLRVMGAPVLGKSFSPASVLVNEESVLTITLSNNNGAAITGAALTDNYPSGLVNAAAPNASTSCPGATLTATAGGNSVAISGASIPASGSCTVSIRVKSAAAGSYNNSTGTVTTTNAGTGGAASATLTVTLPQPSLTLTKLVSVFSDPVNGSSFPKSIPGAISSYTIRLTNGGPGVVDANPAAPATPTFVVNDPLPAEVDLFVGDIGTAGSGPFIFTNGSPSSGLSCSYISLASTTDCVEFSTNGTLWTATPVPDANGFDASIRYIRFRPVGSMNGATGGNPWAEFQFRVRVK